MNKSLSGILLAVAVLYQPAPAPAQDSERILEEVVVTAQRREQSLQEVPVSVTAFTGEALRNSNITEAAHFLNLTPNVSFTQDGQVGSRGTRGRTVPVLVWTMRSRIWWAVAIGKVLRG